MTRQLYLAVDGGGTKTHACISLEGLVVDGYAGASNAQDVGVQQAVTEVKRAVQAALSKLEKAGVGKETDDRCPVAFTTAWICLAGLDSPAEVATMRTALGPYFAHPPASLFVENDALLLAAPLLRLASASEDKPTDGLVVIAGTGSLAMSVRAHHGQIRMTGRRGGLGFLFGDEGSGYHIGREAVRRLAYRRDRGELCPSEVERGLLLHYGARDVDELIANAVSSGVIAASLLAQVASLEETDLKQFYLDPSLNTSPGAAETLRKLRIAEGTRVVLAAAVLPEPDPLALQILRFCAGELASDVAGLIKDNGLSPSAVLCVGGGVAVQGLYQAVFLEELAARGIKPERVVLVAEPARAGVEAISGTASQRDA
ncbi:hypothetical protein EHS25_010160 [Saitozyma podzolica]|uniref:N-acetyl-D-glucosamine kinase n=1 Tax=Saitozyma podzolica TaxID=1890683 RepID=A0A427YIR2_9TREE|nr:hypothetical protein EHS25_010160 [Saitozyma podzolica]